MNNNDKPKKVIISGPMPVASAVDGYRLSVNGNDGSIDLVFTQLQPITETETEVQASAVSHLRLNMLQLKRMERDIESAISDYESKQPK